MSLLIYATKGAYLFNTLEQEVQGNMMCSRVNASRLGRNTATEEKGSNRYEAYLD